MIDDIKIKSGGFNSTRSFGSYALCTPQYTTPIKQIEAIELGQLVAIEGNRGVDVNLEADVYLDNVLVGSYEESQQIEGGQDQLHLLILDDQHILNEAGDYTITYRMGYDGHLGYEEDTAICSFQIVDDDPIFVNIKDDNTTPLFIRSRSASFANVYDLTSTTNVNENLIFSKVEFPYRTFSDEELLAKAEIVRWTDFNDDNNITSNEFEIVCESGIQSLTNSYASLTLDPSPVPTLSSDEKIVALVSMWYASELKEGFHLYERKISDQNMSRYLDQLKDNFHHKFGSYLSEDFAPQNTSASYQPTISEIQMSLHLAYTSSNSIPIQGKVKYVYPNPVDDILHFELAVDISNNVEKVIVIDQLGQTVIDHILPEEMKRVDVIDLSSGQYVLILKGKDGKVISIPFLKL